MKLWSDVNNATHCFRWIGKSVKIPFLQPDNLVVCYEPKGSYITKAPSLIFEILSKSSAQKDQKTKYQIYEREGVSYYIIVDPVDRVAKNS